MEYGSDWGREEEDSSVYCGRIWRLAQMVECHFLMMLVVDRLTVILKLACDKIWFYSQWSLCFPRPRNIDEVSR